MHTWPLQDAKSHFSALIRLCNEQGPQVVTVRGTEKAVILSKNDYEQLISKKKSLFELLQSSPLHGLDIEFTRDSSKNRDIDL